MHRRNRENHWKLHVLFPHRYQGLYLGLGILILIGSKIFGCFFKVLFLYLALNMKCYINNRFADLINILLRLYYGQHIAVGSLTKSDRVAVWARRNNTLSKECTSPSSWYLYLKVKGGLCVAVAASKVARNTLKYLSTALIPDTKKWVYRVRIVKKQQR